MDFFTPPYFWWQNPDFKVKVAQSNTFIYIVPIFFCTHSPLGDRWIIGPLVDPENVQILLEKSTFPKETVIFRSLTASDVSWLIDRISAITRDNRAPDGSYCSSDVPLRWQKPRMDHLLCKTFKYLPFSVAHNISWQPNSADFDQFWMKTDFFQCQDFISTPKCYTYSESSGSKDFFGTKYVIPC